MQHQNTVDAYINGGGRRSDLMFQEISSIPPWTTVPPTHNMTSIRDHHHHDPYFLPMTPSSYTGFFHKTQPSMHLLYDASSSGLTPFGLQAELQKMSTQEIMDAKALAASKSHSEAERRRRERINSHLSKLRSILPNTTKTDKASLLAEVIQHVKELKRQTSQIAEKSLVPTEMDELIVDNACDEDGNLVIRASMCCEDRSDLLPDLIKTLKSMRLRTLKAEIATMGGRFRNVIFITGEGDTNNIEDEPQEMQQYSLSTIQEALRAVMEKASGDDSGSANVKRQRTNINSILEDRSI